MQFLKWRTAPGLAAVGIYVGAASLVVTLASSVVDLSQRAYVAWQAHAEVPCAVEPSAEGDERNAQRVDPADSC